jgi:hypothetical protein
VTLAFARRLSAPLALVLIATAMLAPGSASADPPSVGGCQLFPAYAGSAGAPSAADQTAWNQDVSQTPKDPRSRKYMRTIRRLGGNQSLHPDFGSNTHWGIPYEVVPQSEPLVPVNFTAYGDESDPGPYPIPGDAPVEGGANSDGDRHVLVVQQDTCHLFELGRAFHKDTAEPHWNANVGVNWDLGSAGLREEYWTSADAAGLPILPGLVRYDEVAAGEVDHAIRMTFDSTRRAFIHPASHYASSDCHRNLPPMGLRMRLKAGYYESHLADFEAGSQARPIFEALYRYGVIVADNGSNFFFTGASSPDWDDDDLSALKEVPGRSFVVVDSQGPVKADC